MAGLERVLQNPSWSLLIEDAIGIISERRRFGAIRGGFKIFIEPPRITSIQVFKRYGVYIKVHGRGFKITEEENLLRKIPRIYRRFALIRSREGMRRISDLFYRVLEKGVTDYMEGRISQKFTRFEIRFSLQEIRVGRGIWDVRPLFYQDPRGIRGWNIYMVGIIPEWIAEVTCRGGVYMGLYGPLPHDMTKFLSGSLFRILECKTIESQETFP